MNDNTESFYSEDQLKVFQERGVKIIDASSVKIGKEISPEKISSGSTIFPFVRINGEKTQISSGSKIGAFGSVTLVDSWIGENVIVGNLGPVTLKGVVVGPDSILGSGVAEETVFLGKESFVNNFTTGYGFRIREGSLYEEDASSAQHTDTKMTILFPWATLGSNINFCDVILTGGSGPEIGYFSEVGSGTIHFNFSIKGDKATASLFGDVTSGVFLNNERLFIGGNNSLLGPIKADFGVMTAANVRVNGILSSGLTFGQSLPNGRIEYDSKIFSGVLSKVTKQINVIAELAALYNWYKQIRIPIVAQTMEKKFIYSSGLKMVELNFKERLSQLDKLMNIVQNSQSLIEKSSIISKVEISEQKKLLRKWTEIQNKLKSLDEFEICAPEILISSIREQQSRSSSNYTKLIKNISPEAKNLGQKWLSSVAHKIKKVSKLEKVLLER